MGESHDERMARKKRERQEFLRQQREAEAAEQEALDRYNAAEDKELADFFQEHFGAELDELQKDVHEILGGDEGIERALGEIKRAAKKGKFGKAKRIARQNKARFKKAKKEIDKKKGCAVIALLMLTVGSGVLGSAVWGAVELVSALAR